MRSSLRSVYGIWATFDAEAFAFDKLDAVGNSCNQAKSPVSILSREDTFISLSGR